MIPVSRRLIGGLLRSCAEVCDAPSDSALDHERARSATPCASTPDLDEAKAARPLALGRAGRGAVHRAGFQLDVAQRLALESDLRDQASSSACVAAADRGCRLSVRMYRFLSSQTAHEVARLDIEQVALRDAHRHGLPGSEKPAVKEALNRVVPSSAASRVRLG